MFIHPFFWSKLAQEFNFRFELDTEFSLGLGLDMVDNGKVILGGGLAVVNDKIGMFGTDLGVADSEAF